MSAAVANERAFWAVRESCSSPKKAYWTKESIKAEKRITERAKIRVFSMFLKE